MKKLLLIIFFVLLTSCQKYSEYKKTDRGHVFVTINESVVEKVKNIPWRVGGVLRRQEVSKGFSMKVKLPLLSTKSIRDLVNTRNVDSWLLRVRKLSYSGSKTLGYVYIPIVIPGRSMDYAFKIKQLGHGMINVYYSASAISTRFENLRCPALNHNTLIKELKISKDSGKLKKMIVSPVEREKINRKVNKYGYRPIVLNGGEVLTGRYKVDIAFFNFSSKTKESSYIELPSTVEISGERTKAISGCANFEYPAMRPARDNDNDNPIQKFKFGR